MDAEPTSAAYEEPVTTHRAHSLESVSQEQTLGHSNSIGGIRDGAWAPAPCVTQLFGRDTTVASSAGVGGPDKVAAADMRCWVQCDRCSKWRALPVGALDPPETMPWDCSMNPDRTRAACEMSEEESGEEGVDDADTKAEGERAAGECSVSAPEPGMFIVESILRKRRRLGHDQYLVRWRGYSQMTWEDGATIVADVPQLVDNFLKRKSKSKKWNKRCRTGGLAVTAPLPLPPQRSRAKRAPAHEEETEPHVSLSLNVQQSIDLQSECFVGVTVCALRATRPRPMAWLKVSLQLAGVAGSTTPSTKRQRKTPEWYKIREVERLHTSWPGKRAQQQSAPAAVAAATTSAAVVSSTVDGTPAAWTRPSLRDGSLPSHTMRSRIGEMYQAELPPEHVLAESGPPVCFCAKAAIPFGGRWFCAAASISSEGCGYEGSILPADQPIPLCACGRPSVLLRNHWWCPTPENLEATVDRDPSCGFRLREVRHTEPEPRSHEAIEAELEANSAAGSQARELAASHRTWVDDFCFVHPVDETVGLGLFARSRLWPGQLITEYGGPRLPLRVYEAKQARGLGEYIVQLPWRQNGGQSLVIDGHGQNGPLPQQLASATPRYPATFANHSQHPNARFMLIDVPGATALDIRFRLYVVASECIEAGAEVRLDYENGSSTGYWELLGKVPSEGAWRLRRVPPPPASAAPPRMSRNPSLEIEAPTSHGPPTMSLCTSDHGSTSASASSSAPSPLPWDGEMGGDVRLRALVPALLHGPNKCGGEPQNWVLIATHVSGRSALECRRRWLEITSAKVAVDARGFARNDCCVFCRTCPAEGIKAMAWVQCELCRRWAHARCAKLDEAKAQSHTPRSWRCLEEGCASSPMMMEARVLDELVTKVEADAKRAERAAKLVQKDATAECRRWLYSKIRMLEVEQKRAEREEKQRVEILRRWPLYEVRLREDARKRAERANALRAAEVALEAKKRQVTAHRVSDAPPSTSPSAPLAASSTTFQAVVPPGVKAGEVLFVTMPNGPQVKLQVPHGSGEGSTLRFSMNLQAQVKAHAQRWSWSGFNGLGPSSGWLSTGKSQSQIARDMGVSDSQLSQWLSCKANPSMASTVSRRASDWLERKEAQEAPQAVRDQLERDQERQRPMERQSQQQQLLSAATDHAEWRRQQLIQLEETQRLQRQQAQLDDARRHAELLAANGGQRAPFWQTTADAPSPSLQLATPRQVEEQLPSHLQQRSWHQAPRQAPHQAPHLAAHYAPPQQAPHEESQKTPQQMPRQVPPPQEHPQHFAPHYSLPELAAAEQHDWNARFHGVPHVMGQSQGAGAPRPRVLRPFLEDPRAALPSMQASQPQASLPAGVALCTNAPMSLEPSIGAPVDETLHVGTEVAVLREVWPRYACAEMAGKAWQATVVARSAGAAVVRFTHAQTKDGRRYEDASLSLTALCHLAPAERGQRGPATGSRREPHLTSAHGAAS